MVVSRKQNAKSWVNLTIVMMVVALLFLYFFQWDDMKQEIMQRVTGESIAVDNYQSIPKTDSELRQLVRETYPPRRFAEQLQQLKMLNRKNYQKADLVERVALDRELTLLNAKQRNDDQAYQRKLDLLLTVVRFIESLKDEFTAKQYNAAQTSLINGSTQMADSLLSKVHNKHRITLGGESLDLAARSVHLQGKIAEERLDFQRSYQYHRLSVKYDPQNTSYLLAAGDIADNLALYRNAIIYYEAALHDLQNKKDTPKEQLRQLLTKLAKAWESRADNKKAQEYFRRAESL